MTKKIERTRNTYDETTGADIALNTSTYTVLLAANADRIGYKVTNDSPNDVLINENGGEFLMFKRSIYESTEDNIFTGELTAKSVVGTPTIKVMEE